MPSKYWSLTAGLHSVTFQNLTIFITHEFIQNVFRCRLIAVRVRSNSYAVRFYDINLCIVAGL